MSRSSKEEREVLDAFDQGKLKRSENARNTQLRHQEYAEAMSTTKAAAESSGKSQNSVEARFQKKTRGPG